MNVPKDEILPVFFRGMTKGYAGNGEVILVTDVFFRKRFTHSEGDFTLVDEWVSVPTSLCSFGTTVISYQGNPVWGMQYSGWYEEQAIPILKEVLLETYKNNKFCAGRGKPKTVKQGRDIFTYANHFESGNWRNFKGREEVHLYPNGGSAVLLGHHDYTGILLK